MQVLNSLGPQYRTKKMSQKGASAFAKALSKNPSFTSPDVCEVGRGEIRFVVFYSPANDVVRKRLLAKEQAQRVETGKEVAAEYLVEQRRPGLYRVWKTNESQDKGYYVWDNPQPEGLLTGTIGCTCDDFTRRCQTNGLRCKHFSIVEQHKEWGSVVWNSSAE